MNNLALHSRGKKTRKYNLFCMKIEILCASAIILELHIDFFLRYLEKRW